MTIHPTDEQAQELFNSIRQEIYHTRWDGANIVVGYEPVSPGEFLRAGLALFAGKTISSQPPSWYQIRQLAEQFFPDGVPCQAVPLVRRAFELWGGACMPSLLQDGGKGATMNEPDAPTSDQPTTIN
jgi:hypothetical protein